jgi:hypothetical protein
MKFVLLLALIDIVLATSYFRKVLDPAKLNVYDLLPELFDNPNVIMSDPSKVKTMVENLVLGGTERLHMISGMNLEVLMTRF